MSDPIISEETLTSLEQLCRNAQQIAYNAQEAADKLQGSAKLLNDSLKRAREINRPVYAPKEKVRDGGEKATSKGRGPTKLLIALSRHDSLTRLAMLVETDLKESSIRTYLPILERDQLVQFMPSLGSYRITDAGRAALLS